MSAIALNQHLSGIIAAPPELDWARVLDAVETLKELERMVSTFDDDSRKWRAGMVANMVAGLEKVRAAAATISEEDARSFVLPAMDEPLEALERFRKAYETPFQDRPEFADKMARLSRVSGGAGRYMRKQFKRIEDIRVAQYNAAVDVYYGMLAFRSEFESDRDPVASFSDSTDFGDFLRSQVA